MYSKNQQELLKFLGPKYTIKEIDMEPCFYRKINHKYDIEISGTFRKNRPINVYVWDISNGEGIDAVIVENLQFVHSLSSFIVDFLPTFLAKKILIRSFSVKPKRL